tara:strand:+ start:1138 stop:2028 length:891 start_codon:yes stop_codon:yes gene_type:complete
MKRFNLSTIKARITVRKIIVKILYTLDNIANYKEKDSVYDKKSILEIAKHSMNFYVNSLTKRTKLNDDKVLISSIYTVNKEIDDTIFYIDINKISGYEGSYYYTNKAPLSRTASQVLSKKNLKVEDSYLYEFFNFFQPRNYGELYELEEKNNLYKLSSNKIFMPWLHEKPTNQFKSGMFGPKHKSAIRHRLIRLKNIIYNIKKYGYIPTENDIIKGYIAILGNDYSFIITSGHHRVAVLKALNKENPKNYNLIGVKYDQKRVKYRYVDDKKIREWPGIKSGYTNIVDSLEMYSKFF